MMELGLAQTGHERRVHRKKEGKYQGQTIWEKLALPQNRVATTGRGRKGFEAGNEIQEEETEEEFFLESERCCCACADSVPGRSGGQAGMG